MESAISNERCYQKAIGVVGGRGKAVSQDRGRQKQVPDPKRTEPVWSVLDRTQSETVFQPHPSTPPLEGMAPSVFCLYVKSKIDSDSREGIPLILLGAFAHLLAIGSGAIIKCMLHHPKKPPSTLASLLKLSLQKYSWVEYFNNFTLKVEIVMCLFLRLGSLGEFLC